MPKTKNSKFAGTLWCNETEGKISILTRVVVINILLIAMFIA